MVITTNMRIIIIVSTITLALIVLVGIVYHQRSSFINTAQIMTSNQINTDFFVINESESVAIKAACKKSLDELLEDTTNAASFYVLGHVILKSKDEEGRRLDAQDLEDAYYCFARAASLGFAPALYQMWRMFIDGVEPMPTFLALVYLNLAASEHPELNTFYSELHSTALKKSGSRIVQEIERIAKYKKNIIAQNKSLVENAKKNEHIELRIITAEDAQCSYEYWHKFARKK